MIFESCKVIDGNLSELPKSKAADLTCPDIALTVFFNKKVSGLFPVKEYFFNESYPNAIKFSTQKLSSIQLNYLYNIADAQILLTSNEGWGLTITEAILAGTPIIANVTGGMQDQMRFEDKDGKWFTPTADNLRWRIVLVLEKEDQAAATVLAETA